VYISSGSSLNPPLEFRLAGLSHSAWTSFRRAGQ
jgi:hypothetical protein